MPINPDPTTFLLPFQNADFCGMTTAQYDDALLKARDRAVYIMTTPCETAVNPGWGIDADEYTNDYSGQLQMALEALTGAELLSIGWGLLQKINLLGSYGSPTGESLSLSNEHIQAYINLESVMREKAWEYAYPYVCECLKKSGIFIESTGYNWEMLELDYIANDYPSEQSRIRPKVRFQARQNARNDSTYWGY